MLKRCQFHVIATMRDVKTQRTSVGVGFALALMMPWGRQSSESVDDGPATAEARNAARVSPGEWHSGAPSRTLRPCRMKSWDGSGRKAAALAEAMADWHP